MINRLGYNVPAEVLEDLERFLKTSPNTEKLLNCIEEYRDDLLQETMNSGVSDQLACELRYSARGVHDFLNWLWFIRNR